MTLSVQYPVAKFQLSIAAIFTEVLLCLCLSNMETWLVSEIQMDENINVTDMSEFLDFT